MQLVPLTYEITIVGPNKRDVLLYGGKSTLNNDRGNNSNGYAFTIIYKPIVT
jgi:hypothetical protein